jgi:CheY-like chemotaxis protein
MAGTLIIALSGYGTEQDRGRAYEAGFNYHLTKPVAPATLFEFLSRTLEPPS